MKTDPAQKELEAKNKEVLDLTVCLKRIRGRQRNDAWKFTTMLIQVLCRTV